MSAYNCSDPNGISNGYFVIAKPYYVDGDRIYYYCGWTYFLQGNPIRECDGDTGNWTGSAPICSTTTTTASTTTTTTESPLNEWLYMSIGLSGFLALIFVCIVGLVILKYCQILCRQFTRAKYEEEEVETGCCYTCCIHCCTSGCRRCYHTNNITPPPTQVPKPAVRSLSIQTGNQKELRLEEVVTTKKVAKELKDYWRPHKNEIRRNNQSTN
ncbi:uncharacterized protein LOC125655294 [Ostrea edulis]|uniref:uncharacterized protein LOC125655294 n=1 Tax=Ostrea edulis TaxID=37623 RepID=UPI0024AF1321|nr:uncharacterized protein LOC125655294 [Ostrea edulis]